MKCQVKLEQGPIDFWVNSKLHDFLQEMSRVLLDLFQVIDMQYARDDAKHYEMSYPLIQMKNSKDR